MSVEKSCLLCGRIVTVHPEDEEPICENCQPEWERHLIVKSHMSGELDHTIPELRKEGDDGDEIDDSEAG